MTVAAFNSSAAVSVDPKSTRSVPAATASTIGWGSVQPRLTASQAGLGSSMLGAIEPLRLPGHAGNRRCADGRAVSVADR